MRKTLVFTGIMGLTLAAVARGWDDNPPEGKKDGAGHTPPWIEKTLPAAEHRVLDALAGEWTGQTRMFGVGTASAPSKAIFTRQWKLDGRFLMEEYESKSESFPFNSLGVIGFDRKKGEYVSVWMDTMDTGMTMLTGKPDPSGKLIDLRGVQPHPESGKPYAVRYVFRIESKDKHTIEMYSKESDGAEVKLMETACTRK